MSKRIYYATRDGYSPMNHVLLVQPGGIGEVTVYCPPGIAQGPWVEPFLTMDEAMDVASGVAWKIGQFRIKKTTSKVDWWLDGLSLIGGSDVKFGDGTD